jgi:hypothetical protein
MSMKRCICVLSFWLCCPVFSEDELFRLAPDYLNE